MLQIAHGVESQRIRVGDRKKLSWLNGCLFGQTAHLAGQDTMQLWQRVVKAMGAGAELLETVGRELREKCAFLGGVAFAEGAHS
jgi:hypothetical protein